MGKKLSWYKRDGFAFHSATIGWDEGLKGAYSTIIDLIYMHGGQLPDENKYISVHIGCTKNKWTMTYRKRLLELGKIKIEDGIITNPKASRDISELPSNEKPSENLAKTSGKVDPKTPQLFYQNPHETEEKHPPREEREKEKIKKEPKGSKKKRKRATAWPSENWRPDPLSDRMKKKLNLSQEEYRHEFEKFRDSALANGRTYIDWNSAWRTWLNSPFGTYGRRLEGKSGSKTNRSAGSRNGSYSAGLGGAVERLAEKRELEEQANSGLFDVTPRDEGTPESLSVGAIEHAAKPS